MRTVMRAYFLLITITSLSSLLVSSEVVHAHVEIAVAATGDVESDAQISEPRATKIEEGRGSFEPPDVKPATVDKDRTQPASRSSAAMHTILERELESVETLIKLQHSKLKILEQLRLDELAKIGAIQTDYRGRKLSSDEAAEIIDRRLTAITARAADDASRGRFDSYFIERQSVQFAADIVGIQADSMQQPIQIEVTAVAQRDGTVLIYAPVGAAPYTINTGMTKLRGFELDMASSPPLLAVFASDAATLYALDHDLQVESPSGVFPHVVITPKELFRVAASELTSQDISGIAIARSGRRSLLSIGSADGMLQFFAVNGSALHRIPTPSASLAPLATLNQWFAFTDGSNAMVFRMSRQKSPEFIVCRGSQAKVVAIVFDQYHADTLYVSTLDGEILTFVITGQSDFAPQATTCRLAARTVVQCSEPHQLAVLKGYVVATSSSVLTVFNATRGPTDSSVTLTRLCTKSMDSGHRIAQLSASEGPESTFLAVLTSNGDGGQSLTLWHSLLPREPALADNSALWRSLSFVVAVVVAVLTAQFFLRRDTSKDSDGFGENEQLRKLMEMHSQRPGNATSRFKAPRATTSQQPYMGDQAMLGATVDAFVREKKRSEKQHRSRSPDDEDYRKAVAQARRETLECSFGEDEEY